jgi:predicted nucleotidyltransferase component of viral defense system
MISSKELRELQQYNNYNLGQTEKDFFQNVILFALYKHLGQELVFKGGTCLTKCYGLDRFSEDLDFTASKPIDFKKIISRWLNKYQLIHTIHFEQEELMNEKIKILIQGPLYTGLPQSQCSIRLDVSFREKVLLPINLQVIRTHHPSLPTFEVPAMNKEEIMAEKIRAIMTRNKARDVYDAYLLHIKPDMTLVNKKLAFYNLSFDKTLFEKSLEQKKVFWEPELKNLILQVPEFTQVKASIMELF